MPNPQKLAGQCGKLKCCLNFEYKVYVDAQKDFPPANTPIRTKKGLGMYKKTDVLRGVMWYAYEGENELIALPAKTVKELIEMNRRQEYPEQLEDYKIELASGTAIIEDQNTAEYERELKMLADNSHDISLQSGSHDQQNNSDRNNNRNNRNNNRNHNQNQNQNNNHRNQNNRNQNNRRNNRNNNRNNNNNKSNNEPKQ